MSEHLFASADSGDVYGQMRSMMFGHMVSQTVRAAADLCLADHLDTAPLTAGEVAEREGSAPGTTFRLMRACVALGLLTADADGRFASTPLLATLKKDQPGSMRGLALAATLPVQWLPWSEFISSVRTGKSQAGAVLGMDFFEYLEQHPDQARDFSAGMRSATDLWAADAAKAIDTTATELAVDVGGATGSLLSLLQQANPALRGIVFDRPNVVADAVAEIARKGLSERTDVIGGDFFESVPAADLYLLKFILHDWDDDQCVTILNRCREAMAPGGRIAIVEMVVGEIADPGLGAVTDMNMLAVTTGQERSLDEYDALLAAAGLRRIGLHVTQSPQSVIEAAVALR